jgi:beta-phosphoglucomutase-like phosphatase (HAD superfamily)
LFWLKARRIRTDHNLRHEMASMSSTPPDDEIAGRSTPTARLTSAIFDVDGVLLRSPHEQAWREALDGICDPSRFTAQIYQTEVAGKPRLDGALAALTILGVPDAGTRAQAYAIRKQARLEELIAAGGVVAFPDAVRFAVALKGRGLRLAAASSSRNATAMMRSIPGDGGGSLFDLFDADVSGRAVPRGKPAPDLFLLAALEMQAAPASCFVIEDAPAGIAAARAARMQALGVARRGETDLLATAGAGLVVATLDEVDVPALDLGRLDRCGP